MFFSLLIVVIMVLIAIFLSVIGQGILSASSASDNLASIRPIPSIVSNIALPLGSTHAGEVHLSHITSKRLVVYLQGNSMDPDGDFEEFTSRGWSVLTIGYTNTLIGSAQDVIRVVDEYSGRYETIGIWARSIGTCFAPELCAYAQDRDRFEWVAYITPVSSISDLTGLGKSIASSITEGASLGFRRAQDSIPHYVLLASDDRVTPHKPILRMIEDDVVPKPTGVRIAKGYGHNTMSGSQEWFDLIDELLLD